MRLAYFLITTILSVSALGANSIEQSDWSGGPGTSGPVLSWESNFDTSTKIDWSSIPGKLLLQETTLDHSRIFSKGYETIGTLVSSILEMPTFSRDDDFWGNIFWDAILPPSTQVSFRVRGSDNFGDMGAWSGPITEWGRDLSEILNNEWTFFQYEVTLETSSNFISPELCTVIVTFEADSGGVWTLGVSGTNEFLNDVCFVNSLQGWAVGNNGTILVTYNGGISWNPQNSNTSQNLNSVFFVDPTHGWAAGANGTIINTIDGGGVWNVQASPVSSELKGITFFDPAFGWAVGADEVILASSNGGAVWELRHTGSGVLNGVHYADNQNVITIGNDGIILGTADGGDSWTSMPSGVTVNLNDVFMATPNIIYAVGDFETIINSSNSGQTWVLQHDSLNSDLASVLHAVHFVNIYTGWAVGNGGLILYSESGGEKWILQPGGRLPDDLLGIGGVDPENAVVTGANGTIILYNASVGIEDSSEPINDTKLFLYPNPVQTSTEIRFTLNTPANVELALYDLSGRIVNSIFSGMRTAGNHTVQFPCRTQSGDLLPSGVYICVLSTDNRTVSQPMILIR